MKHITFFSQTMRHACVEESEIVASTQRNQIIVVACSPDCNHIENLSI